MEKAEYLKLAIQSGATTENAFRVAEDFEKWANVPRRDEDPGLFAGLTDDEREAMGRYRHEAYKKMRAASEKIPESQPAPEIDWDKNPGKPEEGQRVGIMELATLDGVHLFDCLRAGDELFVPAEYLKGKLWPIEHKEVKCYADRIGASIFEFGEMAPSGPEQMGMVLRLEPKIDWERPQLVRHRREPGFIVMVTGNGEGGQNPRCFWGNTVGREASDHASFLAKQDFVYHGEIPASPEPPEIDWGKKQLLRLKERPEITVTSTGRHDGDFFWAWKDGALGGEPPLVWVKVAFEVCPEVQSDPTEIDWDRPQLLKEDKSLGFYVEYDGIHRGDEFCAMTTAFGDAPYIHPTHCWFFKKDFVYHGEIPAEQPVPQGIDWSVNQLIVRKDGTGGVWCNVPASYSSDSCPVLMFCPNHPAHVVGGWPPDYRYLAPSFGDYGYVKPTEAEIAHRASKWLDENLIDCDSTKIKAF